MFIVTATVVGKGTWEAPFQVLVPNGVTLSINSTDTAGDFPVHLPDGSTLPDVALKPMTALVLVPESDIPPAWVEEQPELFTDKGVGVEVAPPSPALVAEWVEHLETTYPGNDGAYQPVAG